MNRAGRRKRDEKTCEPKRKYASRGEATDGALAVAHKRGAVFEQLRVYRCLACGSWHFGHIMRKGRHR